MRNPLGNRTALAFSLIALICLLGREGESQTSNTRSSTASKSERTSQEDINWTWHRNDDDADLHIFLVGFVDSSLGDRFGGGDVYRVLLHHGFGHIAAL